MLKRRSDSELQRLAGAAEEHVRQAFGQDLNLEPVTSPNLPYFVTDHYRLWQGTIDGKGVILGALRTPGKGATAQYLKHREVIRRQIGIDLVLLLLDQVDRTIRKQMIERKIGFIAPGAQVYIPEMLLDLRETRLGVSVPQGDNISPTTQSMVLALLQQWDLENISLTAAADALGVSIMSISRSLDELEALQLARSHRVGRERRLKMNLKGRALWDAARPYLQSPLRKTRLMRGEIDRKVAPLAGESALAFHSMLAQPRREVRAVLAASWKRIAQDFCLDDATSFDEEAIDIQTWSYDPAVLAQDGVVDRLSLYLTVMDSRDERVLQTAENLLETFPW